MNNPLENCSVYRAKYSLVAAVAVTLGGIFSPQSACADAETRIISITRNADFGRVEIGEIRVAKLAVTNKGNSALTFSNITVPDGFSVYSFTGFNVSNTVAPGTWTNVFVLFRPTNVVNYGGTGTIVSDATSGSGEFTVSGEGGYPTGQYAGLFYPETTGFGGTGYFPATNAGFDNSGNFRATMAANGGFSGVLRLSGQRHPFSGRLSQSGGFTGSIVRKGMSDLGVSFQVCLSYLHGVISNGAWTADLTAFPIWHRGIPHLYPVGLTEAPGTYRFDIAGTTNLLLAPTNNGSGTINLAASYAAHLSGTLGDGTTFSQSTRLCGGRLPFYAELYDHQGAIMGWIDDEVVLMPQQQMATPPHTNIPPFKNSGAQPNGPPPISPILDSLSRASIRMPIPPISVTNRISGTVLWFKPAQIDTNYPDGFSFQTTVSGPG